MTEDTIITNDTPRAPDTQETPYVSPARPDGSAQIRTVRFEISFDGTGYHGWQRQPNGITVQEVLEERLSKLFGGAQIRIQGSSRTDAGVHALGLVGSCRLPEHPLIPLWKVHKAMNRLLPNDIRLRSVTEMPEGFNARFDAHSKTYIYVVNTGDINPFTGRYSWYLDDMTHLDELREAISFLQGTHDFSTFTVDRGKIDDPVRQILKTDIITFGPLVCMQFTGTGFLYKMVRSMVGALVFVGRGKLPPSAIQEMLEAKNRLACKDTAPAKGLFLKKVFYSPEEWKEDHLDKPPFWMY